MYAKLFSRIAQSSLMEEDVKTRYIFMMLLALADSHGDVIGTDVAIARMMNISKNEFVEGAQRLMQPDADSNSPAYDGRRIILSEAGRGYKLVNYLNYRAIKSDDEKREYMREYMKKRRASSRQLEENVKSVKLCKYQLTDVTHTEAEAEADILKLNTCATISDSDTILKEKKTRFIKPTRDQILEYGKTLIPIFANADRFIDYYEANGWKVGKSPMKSWQAAVRNWNSKAKPESRPTTEKTNYQKNGLKHRPFD